MLHGIGTRRSRRAGHSVRAVVEGLEQRRLLSTTVVLDFDVDEDDVPTTPGQVIDDEYDQLGVTITTQDPVNHPAMIFDSGNPTGGDDDLSGNYGHILIISEDNDPSDPDDDANGGTITFSFAVGVEVTSISLLDVDVDENTTVKCFGENGQLLSTHTAAKLGDNSFQTLGINTSGVFRLEVASDGSVAIPTLAYNIPDDHVEGRMTGGGSIFVGDLRVTHGFELHCAEPSELVNNRLEINWGSPNQHFHLLTLTEVECDDTDIIQQPPDAPIDTLIGEGVGRYSGKFNGVTYTNVPADIVFTLTDGGPEKGEPGIFDTSKYVIRILDANKDGNANDAVVVLDTGGFKLLDKGNHQAHPELKRLTSDALAIRTSINEKFSKLDDPKISQARAQSYVADLLSLFGQFEASNATTTTLSSGSVFSSTSIGSDEEELVSR